MTILDILNSALLNKKIEVIRTSASYNNYKNEKIDVDFFTLNEPIKLDRTYYNIHSETVIKEIKEILVSEEFEGDSFNLYFEKIIDFNLYNPCLTIRGLTDLKIIEACDLVHEVLLNRLAKNREQADKFLP